MNLIDRAKSKEHIDQTIHQYLNINQQQGW
jgi:hypothetical protein